MSGKSMRPCYEASFMVKFLGKRDHAEKFLSGAMLARRLKYFKDLEDDPARWDPNDGLRTYRHISSKPAPASKHFTHVGTVSTGAHGAPRILLRINPARRVGLIVLDEVAAIGRGVCYVESTPRPALWLCRDRMNREGMPSKAAERAAGSD